MMGKRSLVQPKPLGLSAPPPSDSLIRGTLGEEMLVISQSDIRHVELLDVEKKFETADGWVTGREGDFLVTTTSGESYPILRSVFLGTYKLIGTVGNRYAARRLLHIRRAWPITSANAEFSYGEDRGTVVGSEGGWIYQSDDSDYGLINSKENTINHVKVGITSEVIKFDWTSRMLWSSRLITLLAPFLAFLALSAMVSAQVFHEYRVSQILLLFECVSLLLGIVLVWWVRKHQWQLKSTVLQSNSITSAFLVAAEMLGERRTELFPSMSLWRAAQSESTSIQGSFTSEQIRELKDQLAGVVDRTAGELARFQVLRRRLYWCVGIVTVFILFSSLYLALVVHVLVLEMIAIWLPSLIGAFHTLSSRTQNERRITLDISFLQELKFIQNQLYDLVPKDSAVDENIVQTSHLVSALRMLCRVAGQHEQHELQLAISEHLTVPI